MSRTLFVLFVVLALFSISSYAQQCGVNEEFKSCGSACEPSCAKPKVDICTMQCKIGCQCKDGFVRSGDGQCVLEKDCSN
ncbi:chymotrypsin inhibitor-like [Osmia bicornis bicornis]|uniref:chymotrypsin inhibitor-like n=1 Tax=Osmia bicornis bicornis TaxID=1437191 RepID=UPI0010F678C4|nr:chymotrypsin inhibitor-like [Osmia bicornis bicornis]